VGVCSGGNSYLATDLADTGNNRADLPADGSAHSISQGYNRRSLEGIADIALKKFLNAFVFSVMQGKGILSKQKYPDKKHNKYALNIFTYISRLGCLHHLLLFVKLFIKLPNKKPNC
jgi:hypothetical protein